MLNQCGLKLVEDIVYCPEVNLLRVSDEAFAEVEMYFSASEIADLTWAIIAIDYWNRMAISFLGFDQRTVRAIYRVEKTCVNA